ncbi:ABC transporter substrate-binding protein [Caulobacter mirabilis]|uniref:Iron ABC transporter substrate-binding protein n=1 Tax=Caulobacter mirabilis TaxID=69666 RepID=A0A2D2AXM1_9CAUL|nr:ABC transporter substrate-binding protein [Caulobacter mirabilis]ATQ42721.1 iron ABC transporter substrate-binding protein [Caulobacter mirabilis]
MPAPLRYAVALAAGLALAGPASASPRVMSLDSCADQYVVALSPREAIVGVSARADDPDSYMHAQAKGLPIRRATTETVLSLKPDVVVRYWGGDARIGEALDRRGIKVVRIEDATDFATVRANVRGVAAALGQQPRGEALIADMDARLARSKDAWGGRKALYLTPSGYTSGGGTLMDAMLRAAGLTNLVSGAAWEPIPLETLVRDTPAAFVLGFFKDVSTAMTRWGPGRHQALRKRLEGRTVASLPGSMIGCPAWFIGEGVETIAEAAR